MNEMNHELLRVGQRVSVVQQMQIKGWTNRVTGVVTSFEQRKTGSWFARAKDDRLWLDRLVLTLDDGEIVSLNLDQYSRIEPPEAPGSSPGSSSGSSTSETSGVSDQGSSTSPEAA